LPSNPFKEALMNPALFPVTWELVPGRGAKEPQQQQALALAGRAAAGGRIAALTITDNPGGTPALSADFMSMEIVKKGIEPLVHFTSKDKNRSQMESQLYALDRAGVRNLLVMTGDYPVSGFGGRPAPVFDLDPVHTLRLITQMNRGLEHPGPKGSIRLQTSDFFAGAVVSPFKATQAEQMLQYYKLKKKIEAGAQFIVTQLGYDARKFHEVLRYMKQNGINVPLIGNIYVLPFGAAKMMNRNDLPGCVVTDKLLADIDRERNAPDKGARARILRAARMYAILKGMGFSGVHIGGHNITCEQVEEVIRLGEELSPEWPNLVKFFDYPMENGFYYFEKDPQTGLNSETQSKRQTGSPDVSIGLTYGLSRLFHRLMFEPGKNLYSLMKKFSERIEGSKAEGLFHKLEHLAKVALFDCRDCGDCALIDLAYLCPMSQCPKNQRNGPCGGSFSGWCEVYPQKRKCVFVRAYARLAKYGEEEYLGKEVIPPCNWDLYQSSSWINYYTGKDHTAKKTGNKTVPSGQPVRPTR